MGSRSPDHGVPVPPDLGSCRRWSCLQRQPIWGADAPALTRLVSTGVQETLATIIGKTELQRSPRPVDAYVALDHDAFWSWVGEWIPSPAPKPVLGEFAGHGASCVRTFAAVLQPRLLKRERYLGHQVRYEWTVPTGPGDSTTFVGTLGRAAEDLEMGTMRLYAWHIEPADSGPLDLYRFQRTGIPIGWAQQAYPGRAIVLRESYLTSDVIREVRRSPQELRPLRLLLASQAMEATRLRSSPGAAFAPGCWN